MNQIQQQATELAETISGMHQAMQDKLSEMESKAQPMEKMKTALVSQQREPDRLKELKSPLIHPQAVIAPSAEIHPTAVIGAKVVIGERVKIGPYCVIGMPAEWKGMEGKDFGVYIMEGAVLTGLVTVDSGAEKATYISENCYLMKHSHVGHDCQIGANTVISCGAKIGGHTDIHGNCNIGLNAVIHQRQTIAANCMIGMGSVVTRRLVTKPYYKYAGNPAKELGPNVKGE